MTNLDLLREFVENPPPEFVLDMRVGLVTDEDGTVHGCIAGAACYLAGMVPDRKDKSWPEIETTAMEWLELPETNHFWGHPMFSPDNTKGVFE